MWSDSCDFYHPHYTDEETEARGGGVTCLRFQDPEGQIWNSSQGLLSVCL